MSKINLSLCTGSMRFGGAEMQTLRMVKALSGRLFKKEVIYYSAKQTPELLKSFRESDCTVTLIDRDILGRRKFYSAVKKHFIKQNTDIAHCIYGRVNTNFGPPAYMAGVPVVLGGIRGQAQLNRFSDRVALSLLNFLVNGWIVNSNTVKKQAIKRLFLRVKPIFNIPNGYEDLPEPMDRLREKYSHFRTHKYIIATCGRCQPIKNQWLFLKLAKAIVSKRQD
ncbi:MAG: hypothetical protein MPJ24_10370, partial [Pirellulaceae bacterium]|nr:hypothetical protein [Pirellulaceae bacterium]